MTKFTFSNLFPFVFSFCVTLNWFAFYAENVCFYRYFFTRMKFKDISSSAESCSQKKSYPHLPQMATYPPLRNFFNLVSLAGSTKLPILPHFSGSKSCGQVKIFAYVPRFWLQTGQFMKQLRVILRSGLANKCFRAK